MTQRETVLRMLLAAGPKGVSAHTLNFSLGITRSAGRIYELRGEGYNIETIDEGSMRDGRTRMARYVLHGSLERPVAPASPVSEHIPSPTPAAPLAFPCGCVRAANGLGWQSRCGRHAA